MAKKRKQFYLTIFDDDHNLFEIHGPMYDDTTWNTAVCAAQDRGHRIRCSSTDVERANREKIEAYWVAVGRTIAKLPIVKPDYMT
jgi:hypothetical protein